jgi:hypothetical protein
MTQSKDDMTFDISITDDYIIDSDTITINMNDYMTDTIDISSITTTTIGSEFKWDNVEPYSITLNEPVEFEDHMPSVSKVEDMCNDYPALAQAYEKFKTIYAMVHQDWKGRNDDDEIPF